MMCLDRLLMVGVNSTAMEFFGGMKTANVSKAHNSFLVRRVQMALASF